MGKSDRHVESQIAAYPAGEVGQRACRTQRLDSIRLTSGFAVISVAQLPVYTKEIFFSLFLFTPYSLLFLSFSLSFRRIFSLCRYIQQLANPMLGFPCSAIPSSRFQQRPKIGHVSNWAVVATKLPSAAGFDGTSTEQKATGGRQ